MRPILLLLLCFSASLVRAQLLIRNTSIIDVEHKKILPPQDVLVQNGVIAAIGKKLPAPAGVEVIDGTSKWLMPGLVDAHVHFFQSGGIYARPDAVDLRKYRSYQQEVDWVHRNMERFLRRYTRAGITTVVDVGSTLPFLKQRDSFRNKWYAPAVFMTGPLLTTWMPDAYRGLGGEEPFFEMKTTDDARRLVRRQLPYKPDFIKIWYIVMGRNTDSAARVHLPLVQAVIDEAHKNNLRVAVHATEQITARLAVESGADFLVHGIEDEPVDASFVQLLKDKGVVLSPTLVVSQGYRDAFGQTYRLSSGHIQHAHPAPLNSVLDFKHLTDTALRERYRVGVARSNAAAQTTDSLLRRNLKRFVDAGVLIATGTDAGNVGTQHVASYYDELEAMRQSGMDLWQLLQASTINGARSVGKGAEFGSVAVGKRADLLLLSRNPLDSLGAWKRIDLVINRGGTIRPDSALTPSPEELADQQLLAYNAHDLEAFLAAYADDVEVYQLNSGKLQMKGKEQMRKGYAFLTKPGTLHCRLMNRMVEGNMVVDHEEIITDKGTFYGLAIYEIRGDKIAKVWFPD
ncbi:amidohydrolase family protein [Flaviaesturariibacter amylovorans]|uniref:Amidohydrolase family protein n=1 Tax=Flaviaesturariibacter amylovorans TaxID=1084520 RepID=A0ABP8GEU6_9BACT